jgi:hypothetical protein
MWKPSGWELVGDERVRIAGCGRATGGSAEAVGQLVVGGFRCDWFRRGELLDEVGEAFAELVRGHLNNGGEPF